MTELDLAVELDLCGQEINIVVATCKYPKVKQGTRQDKKWSSIDSSKHVQWCNIANSPENSPDQTKKIKLPEISEMDSIGDKTQRYKETAMIRTTSEVVANLGNSLETTPVSTQKGNTSKTNNTAYYDNETQACKEQAITTSDTDTKINLGCSEEDCSVLNTQDASNVDCIDYKTQEYKESAITALAADSETNLGSAEEDYSVPKSPESSDTDCISEETQEYKGTAATTSTSGIELNRADESIAVMSNTNDQNKNSNKIATKENTKTKDSSTTREEHDAAVALLKVGVSMERNLQYSTTLDSKKQLQTKQDLTDSVKSCYSEKVNQLSQEPSQPIYDNQDTSEESQSQNSISSDENFEKEDWEDDENPWLGCICGRKHRKSKSVFWIQCDCCDAWYNCAARCLGFSEKEAQSKVKWNCPECSNYRGTSPTTKAMNILDNKPTTQIASEGVSTFNIGTIVEVTDRTWVGSNKPGGVAKIIDYHEEDNEVFYDVQYVLESRKEFGIESEYVTTNGHIVPELSSPAGSTRCSRSKGYRTSV